MSGRRPLTRSEEKQLLRVVRSLPARDRAAVSALWFSGSRVSEILRLTVGQVWRQGEILPQMGIPPRHLKGKRGSTRWVPILPELRRALRHHLRSLQLQFALTPDLPLFPSRQSDTHGNLRPITRGQAHSIVKRAFAAAGIADDGRLGTHTLRKTMAQNAYRHCRDPLIVKELLGHTDLATTQVYLATDEAEVRAAFAACDFTRVPRKLPPVEASRVAVAPIPQPIIRGAPGQQLFLFPDRDAAWPTGLAAVA